MNKCLVTRLNGSVHDETLPLLGYQQFKFSIEKKGKCEDIRFFSCINKSFKLVGEGYFIGEKDAQLGKETADAVKGIYINIPGSFLINIPNDFRKGAPFSLVLGNSESTGAIAMEKISVEQLLKVTGTSQYSVGEFFIRTNTISGDITKLLNQWGSGSITINSLTPSYEAYGNIDDVVFNGGINRKYYGYYFVIKNIPKLTGNLETLLDKFAQRADYGDHPTAHNMFFTLSDCPLVKYKGKSIGNNFIQTFTIQTDNTWIEVND